MKNNYSRVLSVLLISFSLIFNSCTLIGLGVDLIVHRTGSDKEIIKRNEIVKKEDYETIEKSQNIIVYLEDNSSSVGKFYEITEKYLILRTGQKREMINLYDISHVEIYLKKPGKWRRWKGFIIGTALDIVFWATWEGPEVD